MAPFSDDDRILLYILKTKVKERGRGSWDVCQSIYNELATQTLSPDRLTAAYRNLDIAKLEAEADSAAWDAKREQVERCLLEKEGASGAIQCALRSARERRVLRPRISYAHH